jgi:hypothetical protein
MNRLFLVAVVVFCAVRAVAQTCIVPAPSSPPLPTQAAVTFPPDGGTVGCTFTAFTPGGAQANPYPVSNAKCATMVAMAKQAVANDNGWNDGGAP